MTGKIVAFRNPASATTALPAAQNPFISVPPSGLNTANSGATDYVSALLPFLNDEQRLTYEPKSSKMTDITREEIQAQIAASEARGDTRIVRLEGKIDTLTATIVGKIDSVQSDLHKTDAYNRDTRLITVATIVAAAIALAGLMVAMASYGDAMFGRGMNVQDVVKAVIKENAAQAPQASRAK